MSSTSHDFVLAEAIGIDDPDRRRPGQTVSSAPYLGFNVGVLGVTGRVRPQPPVAAFRSRWQSPAVPHRRGPRHGRAPDRGPGVTLRYLLGQESSVRRWAASRAGRSSRPVKRRSAPVTSSACKTLFGDRRRDEQRVRVTSSRRRSASTRRTVRRRDRAHSGCRVEVRRGAPAPVRRRSRISISTSFSVCSGSCSSLRRNGVERLDDEEQRERDDDEVHDRGEERAVADHTVADLERQVVEVRLADDRADECVQDVVDEAVRPSS